MTATTIHAVIVLAAFAAFVALALAGDTDEAYTVLAAGMSWAGGATVQARAG